MAIYDFSTLSPLDFEELVRDLIQAEEKIRLESFGPGRDQGVDFRFSRVGVLMVVQAKHYPSGFEALLKAVKAEDAKVAALKPRRYILATSVSMSVERKAKLISALPSAPLAEGDVLGREDLNAMLDRHPAVKRQHFKLWMTGADVLERIVHASLYNRTAQEFADIERLVPLFVSNTSVGSALDILDKHGVLIVSGEPGVGKTTLAQMIVWDHAKRGWNVTVVDDIEDVFKLGDEREPHLVFFDDFLGQVGLTPDWIRTVDQRLPPFLRKARQNPKLRFVMTTREYVLRYAREFSDRLGAPDLRLAEFVLDVGVYTRAIKARILFNHIHFSDLEDVDRQALIAGEFYFKIINHKNYNPRIVSLMTSRDYRDLDDSDIRTAFIRVLDDPSVLWDKPYRKHIDEDGRALVLALLFNKAQTPRLALEESFGRVTVALGGAIAPAARSAKFKAALRALEGSFVAQSDGRVRFANPGVRDYLERVVIVDAQLLPIVEQIETFNELSTAWEVWTRQAGRKAARGSEQRSWGKAARSAVRDRSARAVNLIALMLAMSDAFAAEEGEQLLRTALDGLINSGLQPSEVEVFEDVIAKVADVVAAHPDSALADHALETLTYSGADLLANHGGDMDLDTLTGLADVLYYKGSDSAVAQSAAKTALTAYQDEIDHFLENVSNHSELEDLESDLKAAVAEWGVPPSDRVSRLFRDRENELSESYSGEPDESGWSPDTGPGDISDQDIRSMFAGLKS